MAKRKEKAATGGGAATSGGIEFQAATGALYCALMLAQEDSSILDPKGPRGQVETVAFEQVAAVDDIVVSFQGAPRAALQAKRGLALSDRTDSEFAKVIRQFAAEYRRDPAWTGPLVLVVSPRVSAGVRDILRRLLDRLRELAVDADPTASMEEREAWGGFKKLAAAELVEAGKPATSSAVDGLLRRIHVLCIDPEDGGTDVRVALALLRSKMNVEPLLVWRGLVATCLDACKRRGTVTRASLAKAFEKFAIVTGATAEQSDEAFFTVAFAEAAVGSYGRDFVMAKMPPGDEGPRLGILELYRFDEGGRRRYRLDRTHLYLAGNAPPSLVLARASSMSGIERLLPSIPGMEMEKELFVVPIRGGGEQYERSPHTEAHRELCHKQLESRVGRLRCLHCGEAISDTAAEVVEIDNDGDEFDVGPVHMRCRRPVDRVVGHVKLPQFEEYPHLRNFDLAGFARAMRRGQMSMRIAARAKVPVVIAWNRAFQISLGAPYCIEIQLRGDARRYVTERGTLRRYPQVEATRKAAWITAQIAEAKNRRDPLCYTSLSGQFGNYSVLETTRETTEHCIECLRAAAVPYTEHIGSGFREDCSFYAPLLALRDAKTGKWLDLGGTVPLLTHPFAIEQSVRNWKAAGKAVPSFLCSLLATDGEFDQLVGSAFDGGCGVVIDPLFDGVGMPITGVDVRPMPDDEELAIDSSHDRR
jgi:hypothetical protein